MNKERFPERRGVQQATLVFLLDPKNGKILLAMKKRGFGVGHWNGVGGKVREAEGVVETALREAKEEVGVIPKGLERVAILHFYFPDDPQKEGFNQDVHVFFARSWEGEVKETEEMRPKWFDVDKIPYSEMWDDDIHWLPEVLKGNRIRGKFEFNDDNKVEAYIIEDYVEQGRKGT